MKRKQAAKPLRFDHQRYPDSKLDRKRLSRSIQARYGVSSTTSHNSVPTLRLCLIKGDGETTLSGE